MKWRKSGFWALEVQTAPPGPPMEMGHVYSRSNKIPRGQSYLFKRSQNPAATGEPVGSALPISRDQQVGSAETQTPAHPTKGMEGQNAASSQRSAVSSPVSGSMHITKPAQTPRRFSDFIGVEHPTWSRPEEDSGQHGFNKGRFKMSDGYPGLLAKYSFSQRVAEKQEGAQRPFTQPSKEICLRVPERRIERNPDQRTFNTLRISRIQGFDAPPLEGAKPLIHKRERRGEGRNYPWHSPQPNPPGVQRVHNHATKPVKSRFSPANLGTMGNQTEPGPEPRPPSKSHQSRLRDATNVMVSRPPEQPAGLESFTYTDVLGKASFSRVGANLQSYGPIKTLWNMQNLSGFCLF